MGNEEPKIIAFVPAGTAMSFREDEGKVENAYTQITYTWEEWLRMAEPAATAKKLELVGNVLVSVREAAGLEVGSDTSLVDHVRTLSEPQLEVAAKKSELEKEMEGVLVRLADYKLPRELYLRLQGYENGLRFALGLPDVSYPGGK